MSCALTASSPHQLTMVAGTDFWVWAAVWGYWVSLVLTVVSGANSVYKARKILFGGAI